MIQGTGGDLVKSPPVLFLFIQREVRTLSIIRATVNGQRLIVTEAPKLASGGKGTNRAAFEFDESWDGFTRTAVFYRKATNKYKMPLGTDDICDVPPEVTDKKGRMFFGVFGVDGDGFVITSEVVPYAIEEGATEDGAEPSDPSTDFWEEVLAEIAKSETAVREAMDELEGTKDSAERAEDVAEHHKDRHSRGGADEIRPSDIGAADEEHRHPASEIDDLLPTEYDEETETLELGDYFEGGEGGEGEIPEELVKEAVKEYLEENPPEVSGATDEQVSQAVEKYFSENPPQGGGDVPVDGTLSQSGQAADAAICGQKFSTIEEQLEELLYVPIEVTSFSHNAGTRENGDTVQDVKFSWKLNKEPTSVDIDGTGCGAVKEGSQILEDLNLKAGKTFRITASDGKKNATKSTTINFYDAVYYGFAQQPSSVDSAFILSLPNKELSSGKDKSFSITGEENKYFWYAYRADLGESIFNIGGFDYEFEPRLVSFTNKFGVTKDYLVYRSTNPIGSRISVTVKGG